MAADIPYSRAGATSQTQSGTGTLTLNDAAPTGFGPLNTIHQLVTDGDTIRFVIQGGDASGEAFEINRGVYTAGAKTLTRALTTTLGGMSNGSPTTSKVNFTSIDAVYVVIEQSQMQDTFVPAGATFPAYPTEGMQWTLTLTNRTILYAYDGSAWNPVQTNGATTIYVDASSDESGFSDDKLGGDVVGTNTEFATIQKAVDTLPAICTGNVIISCAAGTYSGDITATPPVWGGGSFYFVIRGAAPTEDMAANLLSGAYVERDGSAGNHARVPLDTTVTASAHAATFCKFSGGAADGFAGVVFDNGTATLDMAGDRKTLVDDGVYPFDAIAGGPTPNTSDSVTTYTINTYITGNVVIQGGSNAVTFYWMEMGKVGNSAVWLKDQASANFVLCRFYPGSLTNGWQLGLRVDGGSRAYVRCCLFEGYATRAVLVDNYSWAEMSHCYVRCNNTAPNSLYPNMVVQVGSTLKVRAVLVEHEDDASNNSAIGVTAATFGTFTGSAAVWVIDNGGGTGTGFGIDASAGAMLNQITDADVVMSSENYTTNNANTLGNVGYS